MKTQPVSRTIDLSPLRQSPAFTDQIMTEVSTSIPDANSHEQKEKLRDALSFSVSLGIVAALTGAMLYTRVAVTISLITSALFYFSLGGMFIFAARAIYLTRRRMPTADARVNLN